VNTTESVSLGLNLRSAEGTRSSSCSVRARSPSFGKCGTTRGLGTAGQMSSNSKPGCFRADATNCIRQNSTSVRCYKPETGSVVQTVNGLYCKNVGLNIGLLHENDEQLQDSYRNKLTYDDCKSATADYRCYETRKWHAQATRLYISRRFQVERVTA
jgi:hypothetical protein